MLWHLRHIVVSAVIRMTYCCHRCDTSDIVLSMLWYVRHIVVSVVKRKTCCCQLSQHWQQYVLCDTTLTTICLTSNNNGNNMSYVSQHWQQYIFRIATLTRIILSVVARKTYYCHGCDTSDILLSVLWYVIHIVVSVVIRKSYCCQWCDTYDILLSVLHNTDNNMSYV
jgi:hypothetical protein